MSAPIVLIRHDDAPTDDRVQAHLERAGYAIVTRRPYRGEAIDIDDFGGAVIFGGLYNAYGVDEHPFLLDEYRLIARALDAGVPLLGICQGAQMIAWHLGAEVGPPPDNVHEFGCYELVPTVEAGDFLPAPIHVVQSHWHGFGLPAGATRLASSALYPNQAFSIGDRVFGLQFHAEVTPAGFRRMQERGDWRYGLPGAQSRDEQSRLLALHDTAQAAWFNGFLAKLFPPLA